MDILEAAFWGFVGGAALIVGALIALGWKLSPRTVGRVMAFGAGVLISALSFDLTEEAFEAGGTLPVALGLILGGAVFVAGDEAIGRREGRERRRAGGGPRQDDEGEDPSALALGAVLDGIPESFVIGASVVQGGGVALPVVVAVFLSNVPESLSAAAGFRKHGWAPRRSIALWVGVAAIAAVAAAAGGAVADSLSGDSLAGVNAFAAGAVLAMLADTMMPESFKHGGRTVGLVTTLGFALAFLLSTAS
jgi:ZIP family zinc transporter